MTDTLLIVGGFWIVCGIASLFIAQSRGGAGSDAFVVGLLLGPIGILLALASKPAAAVEFAPTGASAPAKPTRDLSGLLWLFLTLVVGAAVAYFILAR
jgi:hypothetical protein